MKQLIQNSSIETEAFKKLWAQDLIKESIRIASPDLYQSLEAWCSGSIDGQDRIKGCQQAFLKYLIRMSSRCTPFGIFSGVSMGRLAYENRIVLDDPTQYMRRTRLDTQFMDEMLINIRRKYMSELKTKYHLNTSLYTVGDHYRYIKYERNKNGRTYSIGGVRKNKILDGLMELVSNGASYEQLLAHLINLEIKPDKAETVLRQVIHHQVLINELDLTLMGGEDLERILDEIKNSPVPNNLTQALLDIKILLRELDEKIVSSSESHLRIHHTIDQLKVPYDAKKLLQTDLFLSTRQNQLNKKYAYKVKRAIEFLQRINPPARNKRLEAFKSAFMNRYETREVPLNHAMDLDIGIGYLQDKRINNATPILDDIRPKQASEPQYVRDLSPCEQIIQKKLLDHFMMGNGTLRLKNQDFHILATSNRKVDTCYALIEIVLADGKETIVLKNAGGTNGANLMARFAYGSEDIHNEVLSICKIEERLNPNKILAEILHLPESRTGNILKRPRLRSHFIPFLGTAEADMSKAIPLDDILISIRRDRIRLRSKSTNREILPRLTNAHNFSKSTLPTYQLLCDLQFQNKQTGYIPRLSQLLPHQFYIPRIAYNAIILQKAQWRLRYKHFVADHGQKGDKSFFEKIQIWKEENKIPDYVQLVQYDNILTLHLNNNECLEILRDALRKTQECVVQEYLEPAPIVLDKNGDTYSNEFILTYYNSTVDE